MVDDKTQSGTWDPSSPKRTRRWKWVFIAFTVILLVCAFGIAAAVFTACTSNKYIAAAGLPAPDRGYQTGTIYGYDVWIWDCYQNKHIAVYRSSAEMTAGMYERQETPCGQLTPIEQKLANDEPKRTRDPSAFW